MSWQETRAHGFVARHDEAGQADAHEVLRQLARVRTRCDRLLGIDVPDLAVVLHESPGSLDLSQPWLMVQRRASTPLARPLIAGWATQDALHVLAPRALVRRARAAGMAPEVLLRTPAVLYARRAAAQLRGMPLLPVGPRAMRRTGMWEWLLDGAARLLAGQAQGLRPLVAAWHRRGGSDALPPSRSDAALAGVSLLAHLTTVRGRSACLDLIADTTSRDPGEALRRASGGPLAELRDGWVDALRSGSGGRRADRPGRASLPDAAGRPDPGTLTIEDPSSARRSA